MRTRRWLLAAAINLGAAVVAVLAFGIWKQLDTGRVDLARSDTRMEGSIVKGFYDQGIDDVGFVASANKRVTARKIAGQQILYDVVYTTGADHFRVVPDVERPAGCILLFGDSFTFGEGVNDDETLAAQIVSKSHGRVAAKNFGIGGWGPHQFLAGLQSGRFQRAVPCAPTNAVYLLIAAQIARAAGRGRWDTHGPLFRLDRTGKPVRDGNFDTDRGFSLRRLIGLDALTEDEENDLAAALIEEGGRELKRQYPDISFRVVAWAGVPDSIARRLGAIALAEAIPDFHQGEYQLPIDGHPNPNAYAHIADYLLGGALPHTSRQR